MTIFLDPLSVWNFQWRWVLQEWLIDQQMICSSTMTLVCELWQTFLLLSLFSDLSTCRTVSLNTNRIILCKLYQKFRQTDLSPHWNKQSQESIKPQFVLHRGVGHYSNASWEHLQPGLVSNPWVGLTHAISLKTLDSLPTPGGQEAAGLTSAKWEPWLNLNKHLSSVKWFWLVVTAVQTVGSYFRFWFMNRNLCIVIRCS